jgi:Ni,Fe-hydrogenase III small subunit/Pyruvate/2-oxoacid:ferredoxin oxidoreductase delta subunit
MLKIMLARLKQGCRTLPFPGKEPELPQNFRGRPAFDQKLCRTGCNDCQKACPVDAISFAPQEHNLRLDLGRCLFCGECAEACSSGALRFTREFRLAVRSREALQYDGKTLELARALEAKMLKLYGRSLRLRQVSAAGCNACEADINVLGTIVFDLSRFGIQFVASPRHADGLLVTGCVSANMKLALEKTYAALPPPKLVIAVGACALSGGPYLGHGEACNGATGVLPVDLFIPGCPPHPLTILDGLLRLLGKIKRQ